MGSQSPTAAAKAKPELLSITGKCVVMASAIWFGTDEILLAHRTSNKLLFSFALSVVFLLACIAAFVLIFLEWRKRQWRAIIPFASCVFAIVLFLPVGILISHALFAWSLPSYEKVVGKLESGSVPLTQDLSELSEPEARFANRVFASKDTNGVLTVIFFTEEGFPARHSGYLYSSSGEVSPGIEERLPRNSRVRPKWFYVSN